MGTCLLKKVGPLAVVAAPDGGGTWIAAIGVFEVVRVP
jgi:hypothetical protein